MVFYCISSLMLDNKYPQNNNNHLSSVVTSGVKYLGMTWLGGSGLWSVSHKTIVRCQPGMQDRTGLPTSRLLTHRAGKWCWLWKQGSVSFVHGPLHVSQAWTSSQHGNLNSKPSIKKERRSGRGRERGRGRKSLTHFLN